MARGLSEQEIMAHMLGKQANEDVKTDEEIEFDPANFQLDPELFGEFQKMLQQQQTQLESTITEQHRNEDAQHLIKVEHCPTLASEVAIVTKTIEECFPGIYSIYVYEHVEPSQRFDVTLYPWVT